MDSRVFAWVALGVLLVACALPWGRIPDAGSLQAGGESWVDAPSTAAAVPEVRRVSGFRGWLTTFGIRIPNVLVPLAALLAVVAFTASMPVDFRLHPWSAKGPVILGVIHAVQVAVVLHREHAVEWPLYAALAALAWLLFLVLREPPYALRSVGAERGDASGTRSR